MIKKFLTVLLLQFCLVLTVLSGATVTDKGYTGAVFVPALPQQSTLMKKNGVFSLEVKNKVLYLHLLNEHGKNILTLNADASAVRGKTSVIVLLERIIEQAQGRDGYRAVLCINGVRVAEKECSPLKLSRSDAALTTNLPNAKVEEYSHSIKQDGLRRIGGIKVNTKWKNPANANILTAGQITLAIRKTAGRGNPVLGGFNKMTNSMLLVNGGLSWQLQYIDRKGVSNIVAPDSFLHDAPVIKKIDGGYEVNILWHNKSFKVKQQITLVNSRIEADLQVEKLAPEFELRKISFPRWCLPKLPGKDKVVLPVFSGIEQADPTAGLSQSAVWPNGHSTMLFTALYNDAGCGVYLGREDASGQIKDQQFLGSGGLFDANWTTWVPQGSTTVVLPGKAVLELYRGNWFQAGQIYKRFVRTAPWWIEEIPRKDTPEWFRNNPLWIVGLPLRSETVPSYMYFQDYFEVPVSFVAGLLENPNGNWRFGPNFRIKAGVKEPLKELKAAGIHVIPYFNCRLCYAGDKANKENNFDTKFKPFTVKDENGNFRSGNYGGTGLHAVMCPAAPQWKEHLYNNILSISKGDVSGIYHDQLPCSTPFTCFDANHKHPVNDPAAWLEKGHWQTYGKVMNELRKQNPELIHTGEDASDAFLNCIDGFMVWRFGRTGHVPLFQSIYAPRIQFVGRGCDGNNIAGSYESFFPKYAEQLVFGEQIGWTNFETIRYPSPRRSYLKQLAILRYAVADFLNSAEMLPPLNFSQKPETLTTIWGVDEINNNTTDKILHSVWQHTDGRKMVIFINTVNETQTIHPVMPGEINAITVIDKNGIQQLEYAPESVSLEPYAAAFWVIPAENGGEDPLCEKLHQAVLKGDQAMHGDRGLLMQNKPDFKKDMMLNALRQDLLARDISWMVLAHRNKASNLGYNSNPRRNMYGNWVAAQDGAILYYGQVYFGNHAEKVECTLAVDRPGVKVQLIDITEDSPNQVLAEITPEPGEWFSFRKYTVPMLAKIKGRRNVIFKISGGECNFLSWRARSSVPAEEK